MHRAWTTTRCGASTLSVPLLDEIHTDGHLPQVDLHEAVAEGRVVDDLELRAREEQHLRGEARCGERLHAGGGQGTRERSTSASGKTE